MKLFTKKPPLEPVLLSDELGQQVDALLAQQEHVKAVKLVRDRTGLGLVAANNAVNGRRGPTDLR